MFNSTKQIRCFSPPLPSVDLNWITAGLTYMSAPPEQTGGFSSSKKEKLQRRPTKNNAYNQREKCSGPSTHQLQLFPVFSPWPINDPAGVELCVNAQIRASHLTQDSGDVTKQSANTSHFQSDEEERDKDLSLVACPLEHWASGWMPARVSSSLVFLKRRRQKLKCVHGI